MAENDGNGDRMMYNGRVQVCRWIRDTCIQTVVEAATGCSLQRFPSPSIPLPPG
ncbi:protein of unknown function [Limnospira indica PCC 8005]|uniref:Uncharacterized protein n=1 Tax=Limnospira indica PCC 8005 TaxID=376219 RepID=A0A9P1P0H9_9CYAN|nr:protein of unknown function [Limnospira indica PCC 8005]